MPPEEMAGPRAMQEKRPVKDAVMGVRQPDGTVSWINVCAAPILNSAGELEGVVGTFADITEHKQAEIQIHEQLEELRRWQAATLGRENRVLELKSEVNKLLAETGKPPRYASALEAER
jgi:transcriptional regulator with PAS, ATPase and Fis domain